jgi:rhodanese-related sulfurtransferase
MIKRKLLLLLAALAVCSFMGVVSPSAALAQEEQGQAAPLPPAPLVKAEDEFPLRKEFPNVPYIGTEELNNEYESVIIIDVRAQSEYDVVHINKAVNIPVAVSTFDSSVEKLRAKDGSQKIVFYCNGHTCKKSYQATESAIKSGFKNVYAYDTGIFDWIKAYPEKGILLGESPIPAEKVISKEAFERRLLSYADFQAKANSPSSVVIDIREPFQREKLLSLPKEKNIPFDRLVKLLEEGKFKDNQLLCYDAVGKQVDWLQYYLEKNGYTEYYFLKKGVEGTAGK